MTLVYFFNFLVSFLLSFLAAFLYFRYRKISFHQVTRWVGLLALLHFVSGLIHFLWLFDFLPSSSDDFLLLTLFVLILEAFSLFALIYSLLRSSSLIVFLFLYLMSFIFLLFSQSPLFFIALTHVFLFLIFLIFVLSRNPHRRAGSYALLYSLSSLFWLLLLFFGFRLVLFYYFIPQLLLALFLYSFFYDLHLFEIHEKRFRPQNNLLFFLRHLIFIIAIANLLFLSTVGVHESGHVLAAQFYGCEKIRVVVYEQGYSSSGVFPYTEPLCRDTSHQFIILFAGILFPMILAALLFFIGKNFLRKIALLILSFSLLISYGDLVQIGLSLSLITLILLSGLVLLILALVALAKIDQDNFF